jgi:hypothetical protein
VASRLELSAFISHQRLSGQSDRNLGETLDATTRTDYRKPDYGLLHGRDPKIVAFIIQRGRKSYLSEFQILVNECHLFGAGIHYSRPIAGYTQAPMPQTTQNRERRVNHWVRRM